MKEHSTNGHHNDHSYRKLALMSLLAFISMFILMYAMVDTLPNVFVNVNKFYMAGLMTAPMVVIEILLMQMMYKDKRLNTILLVSSVAAMCIFYFLIRQQGLVSDRQFLKSMIPHHASAILMCEEANISDPEVKKLCESIVQSQRSEIEQMKAKLKELE
jgi:hypothetical protein